MKKVLKIGNYSSFTNAGVRGFSLIARFALAGFMAKYFTLEEIGLYGVLYSITSSAPAILGLGINFFLNREIVTLNISSALRRVRDRLLLSTAVALIISPVILSILFILVDDVRPLVVPFFFIFILEVVSLDLHFSLISLKYPVFANSLLFIRSALWVYPLIVLGIFDSGYKTLTWVLYSWLSAQIISFFILLTVAKNYPICRFKSIGFDIAWFKTVLKKSSLVYLSDLGIVGALYLDRYILAGFFTLKEVGVYVFFWTVSNAVQILVASSITQIALPKTIEAYKNGGYAALMPIVSNKAKQAFYLGAVLSMLSFVTIYLILPYINRESFSSNISVLGILLVAATFRGSSDICSYGLYSANLDKEWALINISSLLLSAVFGILGCWLCGINGLALSAIVVSLVTLITRYITLKSVM